jgi:hypothetical protein
MPIQFTCPYCGKQTLVADQFIGQSGPCSGCGQTITIPGAPSKAMPISRPAPVPRRTTGSGSNVGVVLAIVGACFFGLFVCGGVLLALLLPAVQAAREAARRTQCSNNLKQIALAFHNYHDTYKTFPPAYIPDENGRPMHSWRVLILPFLEQQALYNMYNFDEPWDSPANAMVTSTAIPVFQCASDPGGWRDYQLYGDHRTGYGLRGQPSGTDPRDPRRHVQHAAGRRGGRNEYPLGGASRFGCQQPDVAVCEWQQFAG